MPAIKPSNRRYDLVERTSALSENIIKFCKSIKRDTITTPIVGQLIRSGTSIGANYCEADEGSSKRDFINKMSIATKEIKETKYWLQMIQCAAPETSETANALWREVHELNLIFAAIIRKTQNGMTDSK